MSDIKCPYCDHEQEVCHDDGQGYEEDRLHEMDCFECEKTFTFTTMISFDYEPSKADCLNGGEHNYKPTRTIPKAFTRMSCSECEGKRELTEAEKKEFNIPPRGDLK